LGNPCLLLIDFQMGFQFPIWGRRNNEGAEEKALSLLSLWRDKHWPIIHVQHSSTYSESPLHPGSNGFHFIEGFEPLPNEKHIVKEVNSAFIGTELDLFLKKENIQSLIIVGLTTNHCVSTTVRMAANLQYDVTVVHDATACFETESFDGSLYSAESIHHLSLTNLHKEFACIHSCDEVIKQLTTVR
jgi:nicotinamidase-related amidase